MISGNSFSLYPAAKGKITVRLNVKPISTKEVVANITSLQDEAEVICWYEGIFGLPKKGAQFMSEEIISPLLEKKRNIKLVLYSLLGWNFCKYKTIDIMPYSTLLGEKINLTTSGAALFLYSFDFFRFCLQNKIKFFDEKLLAKKYLIDLSAGRNLSGVTVRQLFENKNSLVESLYDMDLAHAYSLLQYVEGYYLIRESVRRQLTANRERINIVFALPNNEGMYYKDLPQDIEILLRTDLGALITTANIQIDFHFFNYGNSESARPYVDRSRCASYVTADCIDKYLPCKQHEQEVSFRRPFLRDVIHGFY